MFSFDEKPPSGQLSVYREEREREIERECV
jgi:hypothetical protein